MNDSSRPPRRALSTGRKTIYIRDADEALWEQAERESGTESLSSILNDALKKYLQDRSTGVATIWLTGSGQPFTAAVEPGDAGWHIHVPQTGQPGLSPRSDVLQALAHAIGWAGPFTQSLCASNEALWVWVPSQSVSGIMWHPRPSAVGTDYHAKAREAWTILRARSANVETMTYGDLGHALGGLHPLHDVPQVLDIIQTACRTRALPDLTGLVVSQRTRMPGRDYWRQNGWLDLSTEEQKLKWQQSLEALTARPVPEFLPTT